jgi:hypothetical protein
MTVRFVPLDAMGEFKPGRLDQIVGWLGEAAGEIVPKLGLDRIDIVVAPTPRRWVIPGWNLNAYAHGVARLTFGIDPECDGAEITPLSGQLKTTLAHELHHIKRFRGPGPHDTLGANLVAEGLAQCFQEEIGCPTPNYALAVRGERLGALAARARTDWTTTDYDHGRWFYGDRSDPTWPWSGGYSLGYVLVRTLLDASERQASEAATIPADVVWEQSQSCLASLIDAPPREAP